MCVKPPRLAPAPQQPTAAHQLQTAVAVAALQAVALPQQESFAAAQSRALQWGAAGGQQQGLLPQLSGHGLVLHPPAAERLAAAEWCLAEAEVLQLWRQEMLPLVAGWR